MQQSSSIKSDHWFLCSTCGLICLNYLMIMGMIAYILYSNLAIYSLWPAIHDTRSILINNCSSGIGTYWCQTLYGTSTLSETTFSGINAHLRNIWSLKSCPFYLKDSTNHDNYLTVNYKMEYEYDRRPDRQTYIYISICDIHSVQLFYDDALESCHAQLMPQYVENTEWLLNPIRSVDKSQVNTAHGPIS